jgi:hypothetical protein
MAHFLADTSLIIDLISPAYRAATRTSPLGVPAREGAVLTHAESAGLLESQRFFRNILT